MSNPMEAIRRLAERLQEQTTGLGLEMRNFAVMPSMDGSPDHVQVVFTIQTENLLKDDEQADYDRQFQQMMKEQKLAEREQQFSEMPDKLKEILRRTKGLLPPDEGTSA